MTVVVKDPDDKAVKASFFALRKATDQSLVAPSNLVECGLRRNLIVLAIMLAVLLEILDTTIVNVALPTMQGSLGENFEDASWILTAYLIAVIIAPPIVPARESLRSQRLLHHIHSRFHVGISSLWSVLMFVPLSVAVLSPVPPSDTTKASAMLSTAIMVTIVDRRTAFHFDHLVANIDMGRPVIAALLGSHYPVRSIAQLVTREATTLGFADANLVGAICALVLVPVALFLPIRKPPPAAVATGLLK